jgi:tRNA A-37 threonylcarbamoyl transferase component Bud32
MIELLLRLIARFMSRIRVNRVEWFDDGGVSVIVKRRRCCGSVVIWLGNRFLALAQSGVQMFVSARAWVAWEQHCVGLLYADLPQVLAEPGSSVRVPAMPGTSLRRLLEQGDLCRGALVAAARELRRAHRMHCCFFRAGWSHGDLHLDNILYDGETAYLIDFDTRHILGIDANRRHADDLKVLLLELIAAPSEEWRELATAFLSEYGEAPVLNELAEQLAVPRGFGKILWYTRSDCRPDREIAPRLRILRETIRQVVSGAIALGGDTTRSQRQ